jgi:hypothetical protein
MAQLTKPLHGKHFVKSFAVLRPRTFPFMHVCGGGDQAVMSTLGREIMQLAKQDVI